MWMKTNSGDRFNFLEPKNFKIHDIAHALSNICRFTGHCSEFYSVAQHSILICSELQHTDRDTQLWALLHDASEAYLGDVSSPLKRMLPDYKVLETKCMNAIAHHFRLSPVIPNIVHMLDLRICLTEGECLMGGGTHEWNFPDHIKPLNMIIEPMPPKEAKEAFLSYFNYVWDLER